MSNINFPFIGLKNDYVWGVLEAGIVDFDKKFYEKILYIIFYGKANQVLKLSYLLSTHPKYYGLRMDSMIESRINKKIISGYSNIEYLKIKENYSNFDQNLKKSIQTKFLFNSNILDEKSFEKLMKYVLK
jgi:hypothetical protein